MGISIPTGFYPQDRESTAFVAGGPAKIGVFASKRISKFLGHKLSSGVSKLTRKALSNPSRAAGYGTGAGIGIALLSQQDETSTIPTTGDNQQGNIGFNRSRSYRRNKYNSNRSSKFSKLCRHRKYMSCGCHC